MNTFGYTIKLVESFTLHYITQPRTDISFFVCPWHRIRYIYHIHWFQLSNDFSRCRESDTSLFCTYRQSLQEFQYIRRQWLCYTQCWQFHEDIDNLFIFWKRSNPVNIFISKQRIFTPFAVRETKADIVWQLKVTHQKLQIRIFCAVVQIVSTLPTQYVFCTFYQHTLEAHACNNATYFIIVNQARVTEYFWFLTEIVFYLTTHLFYLLAEAIFICQWWKSMWIRFTDKLTTSCSIQFV